MLSVNSFIFYISSLIFLGTIVTCARFITQKKLKTNIYTVGVFFIGLIILVQNNIYNIPFLKNLSSYLIFSLILSLTYKTKLKIAIIDYFPIWLVVNIVNVLLSDILTLIGVFTMDLSSFSLVIIKSSFTLADTLFLFLMVYLKPIRNKIINIRNLILKRNNLFIFLIIFFIITFLNLYNWPVSLFGSWPSILLLLILVLVIIGIFYLIWLRNEELSLENKNRYLDEANEFYNKLVKEFRVLQHNINNQFLAIRALANEEVKTLIDENIKSLQTKHRYLPLFHGAPKGLKEILYIKFSDLDYDNYKITLINNCSDELVDKIPFKAHASALEAVGIAVDNAIEAACNEIKTINIEVGSYEEEIYFSITNNFNDEIDIEKLGEQYYTTKKQGHGIGLHSLLQNKTIRFANRIINNYFQVIIAVKIKN